jgi:hypothetical protein
LKCLGEGKKKNEFRWYRGRSKGFLRQLPAVIHFKPFFFPSRSPPPPHKSRDPFAWLPTFWLSARHILFSLYIIQSDVPLQG